MTSDSQAEAEAKAAKVQASKAERAAAELRAATETRTDAEAQAALRTVKRSPAELSRDIHRHRADLVETLNALEDKLNVPRQLKRARAEAQRRFNTMRAEKPLLLVSAAAGAAVGVAGLVWLGIRSRR